MGFQPHAELGSDIIYNVILLYMLQYFLNAWTKTYDTVLLIRWVWTHPATIILYTKPTKLKRQQTVCLFLHSPDLDNIQSLWC